MMFVRDLDVSVDFYRELLGMEIPVRSATAALRAVPVRDMPTGCEIFGREVGRQPRHAGDAAAGRSGQGVTMASWSTGFSVTQRLSSDPTVICMGPA
ncbi:VOC family protein [Nonomuraea sp. NPDC052129]|uniref:VOC family protein n=1 Tax=Nonomuraea sp. NPDC052129 TaxID=3154651 RepID=UPI003418624A